MLDEICDHMDGFLSAEEAWLSSITETLRTWRYVMQETYEGPEESKDDWQLRSSRSVTHSVRNLGPYAGLALVSATPTTRYPLAPRSLWVHLDQQMLGDGTRRGQGLR